MRAGAAALHRIAAFTIARMPALIASESVGHALTTANSSGSVGHLSVENGWKESYWLAETPCLLTYSDFRFAVTLASDRGKGISVDPRSSLERVGKTRGPIFFLRVETVAIGEPVLTSRGPALDTRPTPTPAEGGGLDWLEVISIAEAVRPDDGSAF